MGHAPSQHTFQRRTTCEQKCGPPAPSFQFCGSSDAACTRAPGAPRAHHDHQLHAAKPWAPLPPHNAGAIKEPIVHSHCIPRLLAEGPLATTHQPSVASTGLHVCGPRYCPKVHMVRYQSGNSTMPAGFRCRPHIVLIASRAGIRSKCFHLNRVQSNSLTRKVSLSPKTSRPFIQGPFKIF